MGGVGHRVSGGQREMEVDQGAALVRGERAVARDESVSRCQVVRRRVGAMQNGVNVVREK